MSGINSYSLDVEVIIALGHEKRIEILQYLGKEEFNVNQIADNINLSRPAISHHLQILKRARLVFSRREGKEIYYSVNEDAIRETANHLLRFVALGYF